ncbi:hypothetical protein ACTXT7_011381 [Hymenolepis weldensis]
MNKISPSENPDRVSWGKRAKRTVTAPSLSGRLHSADARAPAVEPQPLANRYASQDNGLWPFSSSGYLSPRLKTSSSSCLRDVKEVFTIQQIMRDTLETRLKPQSADKKVIHQRNHHKKEFLRSWSRERIIVTEEIIYPTTNLSVASASGSYSSIAGPQSKPYYPLVRYNTTSSGKSLPLPHITMVGALPSHVAEHGKKVPLSTTNITKTTLPRDRRANLLRQASEPESSTLLFSDLSSVGSSMGARVIPIKKESKIVSVQSQTSSQTMLQRPITAVQRNARPNFLSAMIYMLMEHADEDQFVISANDPSDKALCLRKSHSHWKVPLDMIHFLCWRLWRQTEKVLLVKAIENYTQRLRRLQTRSCLMPEFRELQYAYRIKRHKTI